MAIKNDFSNYHDFSISMASKKECSVYIPIVKIIEYSLEEFKPERRVYAKRQIDSYQRKIDMLFALNHLEMKPMYIYRINKLIRYERGEITE
ncbi:unnamed protein product [marine sediment metagenome]|uniref:Uncharacterized protein n=1 Tax=marine sediment metagenome TaxID=412755 RepID=X1KY87_9ZZZZ